MAGRTHRHGLFRPIDLGPHLARGGVDGAAGHDRVQWTRQDADAPGQIPPGTQRFWGVPFRVGVSSRGRTGSEHDRRIARHLEGQHWLTIGGRAPSVRAVTIKLPPTGPSPTYLVFLHQCAMERGGDPDSGGANDVFDWHLGQRVADYVLVFDDGTEVRQPIRWHFEVGGASVGFLQNRAYSACPHIMDTRLNFRDARRARTTIRHVSGVRRSSGNSWVYALPVPDASSPLRALRIEAAGPPVLAVAGLTAFYGRDNPLRHRRLESFRITVPRDVASEFAFNEGDLPANVSIDLGVVARAYPLPRSSAEPADEFCLDITATADATLRIGRRNVPLCPAYENRVAHSSDSVVRVEMLPPRDTWLRLTIEDEATGAPIAARIWLQAADGRYLAPYGRRQDVNDRWHEDHTLDVRMNGPTYAYVNGACHVQVPTGDLAAEGWCVASSMSRLARSSRFDRAKMTFGSESGVA